MNHDRAAIVASERELEDLIWKQGYLRPTRSGEPVELLGRQIRLLHGHTLDLLGWWEGAPVIIELKLKKIQDQDVSQTLRYRGELERLLVNERQAMVKVLKTMTPKRNRAYHQDSFVWQRATNPKPVRCLVIGKENTPAAWWATFNLGGLVWLRTYHIEKSTVILKAPHVPALAEIDPDLKQTVRGLTARVLLETSLNLDELGAPCIEIEDGYREACYN